MAQNLVIVESPAKARTIGQYLGTDFDVESSFGHIRDLPKKQMGVDIKKQFEPEYIIPDDKQKVVAGLKKAAKIAKVVWLATDEDREGEAIAWHLCKALGLDPVKTKRIVFHEITKSAIEAAVGNPRTINQHLVDAQQARRVLDRLVGYELSPVLWRKISRGLSAGRVQSVAVRLIVEREREIRDFKTKSEFSVNGQFKAKDQEFAAELSQKLADKAAAKVLLEKAKSATFKVTDLSKKPAAKSPSAPFTTSSLQQAASNLLGFSVRQTMVLAQRLYEAGYITYMRTDSLNLADSALAQAAKEIKSRYGDKYYERRSFKTSSKLAQEAHEAIRPTDLARDAISGERGQIRLYELIWSRTMASQMAPAQIERTVATIAIGGQEATFIARGEILRFDGFMKVMSRRLTEDIILPALETGQTVDLVSLSAREGLGKPPARYSEASLVKKLEQLGIGRPSTYAPTISTIQSRGYVEKADHTGKDQQITVLTLSSGAINEATETIQLASDRNRLSPTEIGEVVTDFLVKNAAEIMDYQFTAHVEDDFDKIADGKQEWHQMLESFYGPFHKLVEKSEAVSRQEATQMRKLGTDPASKRPMYARLARFGPVIQVGEKEDEVKPRFVAIPKNLRLDEITLEQALDLLKLPRELGKDSHGELVTADIGPYGPYVRVGKLSVSLGELDPMKVGLDEALALIKAKIEQKAKAIVKTFKEEGIEVRIGPYGPYVTDGKRNAPLGKALDPAKIDVKAAQELLDKKGKTRRRRPATA